MSYYTHSFHSVPVTPPPPPLEVEKQKPISPLPDLQREGSAASLKDQSGELTLGYCYIGD
jgi:hypothetical protein